MTGVQTCALPIWLRTPGVALFLALTMSLFSVCSGAVSLKIDDTALKSREEPGKEVVEFLFTVGGFLGDQTFSAPMGVFYDIHDDEIYVADTGNNQVAVFSSEGEPRFKISSVQGLNAPLDVVTNTESRIYISQMGKNALQLFDFRGAHLADLYAPDSAALAPGRLCIDLEGNIYVVDRRKAEILVYDAAGDFQFRFGGKGEGAGKFRMISGIALDSSGRIYVADSKQTPIQVFDKTGRFLLSFGGRRVREGDLAFPGGICVDKKDRIWIVDTFNHQIKVFKTDGTPLFHFGDFGEEPGKFFFPIDLALDGKGRIYVLEKGGNRLQAFKIHGW